MHTAETKNFNKKFNKINILGKYGIRSNSLDLIIDWRVGNEE